MLCIQSMSLMISIQLSMRADLANATGAGRRSCLHARRSPSICALVHPVCVANDISGVENVKSRNHFVKVCGIASPKDAADAAAAGATHIGMILWPKARRSVQLDTAREIASVAREFGAEPVGVFVDEDAGRIVEVCDAVGVGVAQLHGNAARKALVKLPQMIRCIYVLQSDRRGVIQTPLPERSVELLLVDSMEGGSGIKLDWEQLSVPLHMSSKGWLLAGGLDADNVSNAISIAQPTGVDVSSGVCFPDGIRKDPRKVQAYVSNAWASFQRSSA